MTNFVIKLLHTRQMAMIVIFAIILLFVQSKIVYGEDKSSSLGTEAHTQPNDNIINCSLESLSETNVDCWNKLFGNFFYFKGIVSYQVTDFSGKNDIAIVFIGLGRAVQIPEGTIILPDGKPYTEDQNPKETEAGNTEEKVVNKVFYGLILQDTSLGKYVLRMYGDTHLHEYNGNCSGDYGLYDLTDSLKGNGIKRFCTSVPDFLPTFEIKRIFSNKPPLLVYHFEPAGDASGVYDAAYIYHDHNLKPLFQEHNGKYDLSTLITYQKNKIIMNSPLNTPFEPEPLEAGYWYFNSFTLKTGYVLENDKLVVVEEKIEPTSIDISEECGNWCIENYTEKLNTVLKEQKLFEHGKNKWLGDPLQFVLHSCPKCKNIRTIFQKDGVAIVWADSPVNGIPKRVRYYLYKPLFKYKNIGKKSIWQEMD